MQHIQLWCWHLPLLPPRSVKRRLPGKARPWENLVRPPSRCQGPPKENQQGTPRPIIHLVSMEMAAAVVWPYSTQVLPSKVDSLSNAVKQKNVPTLSHPGNFPELSPRETLSVGNSPHKILSCPGLYLVCVSSRKRSRTEAGTSPWSTATLIEALATSGEASLAGGAGV